MLQTFDSFLNGGHHKGGVTIGIELSTQAYDLQTPAAYKK